MCIQNKLWQAQQHWIAVGILVEALLRWHELDDGIVDQHDERKRYSRKV